MSKKSIPSKALSKAGSTLSNKNSTKIDKTLSALVLKEKAELNKRNKK